MEMIVLYVLDDLLRDPALRMLIADKCYAYHQSQNDDSGAYEASIKSRLKEVEGKLANLLKALEAGIFNDTTAERMNVLENEKNMLADALLAEQNRKKYDLKYDDVLRFLESFIGDLNNPDTRRTLLDGLIDKIYVYPDKLAITSFYSGDRRELPFGETVELIKNRQSILALLDGGQYDLAETEASAIMLESLSGDTEEPPGFFP